MGMPKLNQSLFTVLLFQSLQPYGFIRNFYGNDLSITEYGNRLNFTEVGIIWKILDMGVLVVLQPRRSAGGKFKVSWKLPVGITASSKGALMI